MSANCFYCPSVLLPQGWREDRLIRIDAGGMIDSVEPGRPAQADIALPGVVVPGMVNVHSHIHQRLIAGLTGYRAAGDDSFWTWREQMYRAIGLLDEDGLESLAAWAWMELLEGGYTTTGEFHYPHRLRGSDPVATAKTLLTAADRAGCSLTLLPVWYRHGGFSRQPVATRQQAFVLDADEFAGLVGTLRDATENSDHRIGLAPHSLRAVDAADLPALLERLPGLPVHLHIAEQPGEVEECLTHTGRRPIEWLADHVSLDEHWCLIHATHAGDNEIAIMAEGDITLGICPTTEADLGDGLFPVHEWLAAGGRLAIGSDSNLAVSAAQELRLLEWGQRLRHHQRNVLAGAHSHVGTRLWQQAARDGARALAQPAGEIRPGCRADWLVLAADHPLLAGLEAPAQLDTLVLAEQAGMIDQVWARGRQCVAGGRHPGRERLAGAVTELRRRLQQPDS